MVTRPGGAETEVGDDFRVPAENPATFPGRIRLLVGEGTQRAYAKKWDISLGTLTNYLSGVTEPNRAVLERIAVAENVRIEWLVTGAGPMRAANPVSTEVPTISTEPGCSPIPAIRVALVPRYAVAASAGPGREPLSEEPVDRMVFDLRLLDSIGVSATSCFLMNVAGDSALPTLADGALILVDRTHRTPFDTGLYVLRIANDLYIKRLQQLASGGLRLISDNPVYPPDEVAPADLANVTIIGRVVWPSATPRRA